MSSGFKKMYKSILTNIQYYSTIICTRYSTILYFTKELIYLIAVNYSTIREKLKYYCDRVTDNQETVIVTRKDEKNVVIISLDEWNELQKAARNMEYLSKIDLSLADIEQGRSITKTMAELEAMTDG